MRTCLAGLMLAVSYLASPSMAAETYDLIFRTGTLSDIAGDQVLEYDRTIAVAADAGFSQRNTGIVRLSLEADDMARLRFSQGEKGRALGDFPASVGNPIIMYFVETVLRDVAQQAGGSPFYIRNRIKESLVQVVEIETGAGVYGDGTVPTQQITLRPFQNDPNRERMRGYGDLELTFTLSEDVPGWYRALEAHVPGEGDTPIYTNLLELRPTGDK